MIGCLPKFRWPGGIIPYTFARNCDDKLHLTVRQSMSSWQRKVNTDSTVIQFLPLQGDSVTLLEGIPRLADPQRWRPRSGPASAQSHGTGRHAPLRQTRVDARLYWSSVETLSATSAAAPCQATAESDIAEARSPWLASARSQSCNPLPETPSCAAEPMRGLMVMPWHQKY